MYGGTNITGDTNVNLEVDSCIVEGTDLTNYSANSNSNVSGIVGFFYGGKNASIAIKNSKVANTTLINLGSSYVCNNTSGIFSGIYGPGKVLIDGCEIENSNIESTKGGNIAGINSMAIRAEEVEINNCKVNNLSVKIQAEDSRLESNNSFGGILGMSMWSDVITINNCSVKGITIDNAKNNVGGIVGHFMGDSSTRKFEMTNCEISGYYDNETNILKPNTFVAGHQLVTCGGMIGFFERVPSVKLEDLRCSDIVIEVKDQLADYSSGWSKDSGSGPYQLGGFVGEISSCTDISISDINLSNIEIDNDYAVDVGGFIGLINGGNFIITDVNASDINIKESFGTASAFIANWLGDNSNINNVEISDYNIIIDNPRHFNNSEGYYVSGLVSKLSSFEVSITNITMNNGNIELRNIEDEFFKYNHDAYTSYWDAGAIAGLLAMNEAKNIDISDIQLDNFSANVEFKNKERNNNINEVMHMAGIIGVDYVGRQTALKTNIENVSVTNLSLNNEAKDGTIGGLISAIVIDKDFNGKKEYLKEYLREATIKDSTITNITANGKYAIGGIIGCGKSTIENCTVKNPILTGTSQTSTVGGAMGIAVEDSNATNVTVTADLPEGSSEQTTYGIFSDYLAGGIAAINSGALSDSKVENIIVKTFMKLLEESEVDAIENSENEQTQNEAQALEDSMNEETQSEEQTEDDVVAIENATNTPCADEVQVQYFETWTNCIVNNVKLIQEKISA